MKRKRKRGKGKLEEKREKKPLKAREAKLVLAAWKTKVKVVIKADGALFPPVVKGGWVHGLVPSFLSSSVSFLLVCWVFPLEGSLYVVVVVVVVEEIQSSYSEVG